MDLAEALKLLRRDEVQQEVQARIAQGLDPVGILDDCRQGMSAVGDLYQRGDYYLSELLLSAGIFRAALETLEPHLASGRATGVAGRILLATPQGDIHDLGKDILKTLLIAQGFEVCDLGVDVSPSLIVEKTREFKPGIVGFSSLLTTTFAVMKEAASMLEASGLREDIKVMIGGGVTTPGVRDYVGADFETLDAMEGADFCARVAAEEPHGA